MGFKMGAEMLSDSTIRLISKELRELNNRPEPGIRVIPSEDNVADVQAEYDGPAGTPFEGGIFRMKLVLGHDFPEAPPKGYFLTKIFHPNVSKTGEICVNVLKKDWKPELGLRHVLVVIRCLLIEPFAESALNEEAGKMLLESFEAFSQHARLMTDIHAKPARRPTVLTASGGANVVNSQELPPPQDMSHHALSDSMAPPVKKPKGIEKSKPMGKKRSLKRL